MRQFTPSMASSPLPLQNEVQIFDYFGLDSVPMNWEDWVESPYQPSSPSFLKSCTRSGGNLDTLSFIELMNDTGLQGAFFILTINHSHIIL